MTTVFEQHRAFYGAPRIHRELRATGLKVGRHRVAQRMQRSELKARRRRCFRPCSDTAHGAPGVAKNLLQQDIAPPAPKRCWAGDMTTIRTKGGWRYLAVSHRKVHTAEWIDLYSRRVVGRAMGATMEAILVLEALNRALGHRQIEPDQLVIYTDQGSQYRANAYLQLLEIHKITPSMLAKGCCWDTQWRKALSPPSSRRLLRSSDTSWILMTTQSARTHPSSCNASWPSGLSVTTTVTVGTQRSVT